MKSERIVFIKFLITSGFAALVNIIACYIVNLFIPYQISIIIAYLIAMLVAYFLARIYVFKSQGNIKDQLVKFSVVNGFALLIVWVTSVSLARCFFPKIGFNWHPDLVAHIIGVSVPAFTSYFGHKHFSFSKRPV